MEIDDNIKKLALLIASLIKKEEEREAVYNQYRGLIDEGQRIRLKRQLDDLDRQIDDLKTQIDNLNSKQTSNELKSKDKNRRILALENKLSKIDFEKQVKIVKDILDDFADNGAALFFVNDYLKMAGDLFGLELKEILNEETTDLLYYPIEFSVETTCNEVGFLERIGDYVDIRDIKQKEDYSKIIEKLLELIESGSIILIELNKFDLFDEYKNFLAWLVDNFWQELTQKLLSACQLKDIDGVKFIIVINSDDDIFEEFSNQSFWCQNQCFNMSKIFAILLENWTENDIECWLKKHPGLPKKKRTRIAKSIYKSSNEGIPSLVREAIRSKLS